MKKTIIALAAIVMTAGVASADNNMQAEVNTARDAAPVSVVVKQPANVDYSSKSAFTPPAGATNQQERELLIKSRADNR
jgi:hypothetical protein